jgi:hypothetical protein
MVPSARDGQLPPIRVNAYASAKIDQASPNFDKNFKGEQVGSVGQFRDTLPAHVNSPTELEDSSVDSLPFNAGLIGSPEMFLSAFAEPTPSPRVDQTLKVPTAQIIHDSSASSAVLPAPVPLAIPPRTSDTPAGPQLSPTKWVHQPLVARKIDQRSSVGVAPTQSTVQMDARTATQRDDLMASDDAIAESPRPSAPVRPLTEIRRAAMRQRATRTEETLSAPIQTEPIQPGYSIEALRKTAM